jgi:hypothetical protein
MALIAAAGFARLGLPRNRARMGENEALPVWPHVILHSQTLIHA